MAPTDVAASAPARRPRALGAGGLALWLAAFSVYSLFSLQQDRHFKTSAYDSVIFDQVMRAYSNFQAPISVAKEVHNNLGTHFVILGDHFSPILILLTPLYWAAPRPTTLLLAQAFLFACSVPVVLVAARRLLAPTAAYLAAVAYALSWGLQSALSTDFHEIAFAVPLVAIAIERDLAGRRGQAAIAAASLLLVKEDLAPLVATFGIYLAIRGARRLGLILTVAGLLAFELITKALMPAFGGHTFAYWTYSALGASLPAAVVHVLAHPLATARLAVTPAVKARTLAWTVLPWGGLCVLSPIVILLIPVLAERMLSSDWHYWTTMWHYSAVSMPIVALASIDGLSRLLRWHAAPARLTGQRRRIELAWGVVVCSAAVAASAFFPFHVLVDADYYRTTPRMAQAQAIVAAVPSGVTIEVDSALSPHLTARTNVLMLDRTPRGAPWVLVDTGTQDFPFRSLAEQQQRVSYLLAHGYHVVDTSGPFVLLRRG